MIMSNLTFEVFHGDSYMGVAHESIVNDFIRFVRDGGGTACTRRGSDGHYDLVSLRSPRDRRLWTYRRVS